jgi:signal transduction histidine kinase
MKRQISLRLFITLVFLSLAVLLVIGYSILSAHYYMRGMDSLIAGNMEDVARSYVESTPQHNRDRLTSFSGYQIASQWSLMPDEIREAFGEPPSETGVLIKQTDSRWPAPPDIIYFLFRYQNAGEPLFVSRRFSRETASALIGRNTASSMQMLLAISIGIAAVLALTFLLILRRVSRPVAALGQWARELNSTNVSRLPPDFSYPELNELAGLIQTSLSSVQESLEREHRFLRHASHELRTPIAIIRNNVELLYKLEDNRLENHQGQQQVLQHRKVIARLDRAGQTMQHLTETLLWLGKDIAAGPIGEKKLELDRLLMELVDDMKYLLSGKKVELDLITDPCTVVLPETPTRIVLGNLIRNAFQHSWEGRISIHQHGNRVVIINPQPPAAVDLEDLGFGLGLQLTRRLTEKLGWMYTNETTSGSHRATLLLDSAGSYIGHASGLSAEITEIPNGKL